MQSVLARLQESHAVGNLFDKRPLVKFREPASTCAQCSDKSFLRVKEVRSPRLIATMPIGEFFALETILYCPTCLVKYPSSQFRNLAPGRSRFGYDVIEFIGRAMFLEHCRDIDIVQKLKTKNIEISEREVAFLGKKFIIYLALAHREAKGRIRRSMDKRGGYILHLDGTCDGDSPHLISCLDGLSKIVLDNIKAPSEKSEHLIPFLEEVKADYGEPLAMVHDMGRAIQKAVDTVFPGIADYICHFHFLRDIGKDLLEADYSMIRTCLKNSKVRSDLRQKARLLSKSINLDFAATAELKASLEAGEISAAMALKMPALVAFVLIHWILDANDESGGYGFPFDRPHFVFSQRLNATRNLLHKIKETHLTDGGLAINIKANAPLARLYEYLNTVLHNKHLSLAAQSIENKVVVFDALRSAMRIAVPEEKSGLNDDGENVDLPTIELKLIEFKEWINSHDFPYDKSQFLKLIGQLNKYWPKLFAAPITIEAEGDTLVIQPQRTNNDLERLFRDMHHGNCKKTGTSKMNRALKAMLADTPLVRNLKNEEYVSIVLNGHSTLADRFAEIDAQLVREKINEANKNTDRLPGKLKRLLRRKSLIDDISQAFSAERH